MALMQSNDMGGGRSYRPPIQYTAGNAMRQAAKKPVVKKAAPKKAAPKRAVAAPRPAVPAAPAYAPPAPAPAPVAPPSYPWLDNEFNKYFGAVQQDFADRGLLDSTNKMEPMKELADAYSARYAQEARTDNQRAVENAMRLWELLTSGELSRAQLLGSTTMNTPSQPSIFSNIFNQSYLPPLKSAGGPQGDAKVVSKAPYIHADKGHVIPTYDEEVQTLGYQQFQQEKADSAANRAIQQAYLKLAQQQEAREAAAFEGENGGDKWEAMAQEMMGNRMAGLGESKGMYAFPTQMLTYFKSAYGVDIEDLVRQNDPRAIALVRSAYGDPKRADKVIARMQGKTPAPTTKAASGKGKGGKSKNKPPVTKSIKVNNASGYDMLRDWSLEHDPYDPSEPWASQSGMALMFGRR